MVHPVARVLDHDCPALLNRADAAGALGVRRPALGALDEQRRCGDLPPNVRGIFKVELVRGADSDVVIEFPGERPVLVHAGAIERQVAGHFGCQVRISLDHSSRGLFPVRITPRLSALHLVHVLDPLAHAYVSGLLFDHWRTPAFDRDHARYGIRKAAGVLETDRPAERVTDYDERTRKAISEDRGVVDEFRQRVHTADRPTAVAVAAQVGRVQRVGIDQP